MVMEHRAGRHTLAKLWWLILGLTLLGLVLWQWWLAHQPDRRWQDLWMSRDQQGEWYFQRGEYLKAAQVYHSPDWVAMSLYAAQQFDAAQQRWSRSAWSQADWQNPARQRQRGAQLLFNQANSLAQQEDYPLAADYYQLALQLQPGWLAAEENLSLVQVLGKQPKKAPHQQGEVRLDADEIVFDLDKDEARDQEASESQGEPMSAKEIQALWMRQLQTRPVDFLRLKFRYQVSVDPARNAEPAATQAEPAATQAEPP
ncbi:tetratricopeptide repeat protein [Pseudomaricurvus hydrocarbonicus]|nr:tetratricopeptide repeat protein [Aestuariicella hydrocarbonica]